MVRPRGWHLDEKLLVGGKPISGALFDFGLYFFHKVKALIVKGTGPYFYLPKWRVIWKCSSGTMYSISRSAN